VSAIVPIQGLVPPVDFHPVPFVYSLITAFGLVCEVIQRVCPLGCDRKPTDGVSIAVHYGHRNAKLVPRSDKVVVESLDLNGVTKSMSGTSLGIFIAPKHPAGHPDVESFA
jgi:hypothetical protein